MRPEQQRLSISQPEYRPHRIDMYRQPRLCHPVGQPPARGDIRVAKGGSHDTFANPSRAEGTQRMQIRQETLRVYRQHDILASLGFKYLIPQA
jgi:hypothetical protein